MKTVVDNVNNPAIIDSDSSISLFNSGELLILMTTLPKLTKSIFQVSLDK